MPRGTPENEKKIFFEHGESRPFPLPPSLQGRGFNSLPLCRREGWGGRSTFPGSNLNLYLYSFRKIFKVLMETSSTFLLTTLLR